MSAKKSNGGLDVHVIEFNNYVIPDIKPVLGQNYIDNHSFFKYVKQRFYGSPTNAGIIKNYVNYIIGEGLVDRFGDSNVYKYISRKDFRLMCLDYVMYGQFSVQIIWSKGSKMLNEETKPIYIKYIPTEKIALNQNAIGDIDGYWYSYDWDNQIKYPPRFYTKFDGLYKEDYPVEIFTVQNINNEDYFPKPDYVSALQWAHVEEELANSAINYILNSFSLGKIINFKGGVPPTEELKQQYIQMLQDKLTGTSNKNKYVIMFQDGKEGDSVEVINMQVDQLDSQLVYFSEEAQRKLFAAHGVTNPILFGVREGSGLGSNKDEMKEALKILYRSNIRPMREVILDGLDFLFRYIDDSIQVAFEDFEELRVDESTQNNVEGDE